jgi:hypothetical protein
MNTGRQIFVDDEDKHILYKYFLNTMKTKGGYTRYVVCKYLHNNKHAGMLHRIILNVTDRKIIVDHEDGNGLNCTKNNLRICDYSQNQFNRRLTAIYHEVKGLQFRHDRGYWVAYIGFRNKRIRLGAFAVKQDAINARLAAEKFYYGEFNGLGTTNV